VDLAREGMENFIRAQKHFLDVVAEETAKVTGSKRTNGATKKMKKTELAELARQATDSFIDAQKKLFDVAGKQINLNLKVADKTVDLVRPFSFMPLAQLTREGVRSYVDAGKALMDVMLKPTNGHKREHKPERHAKRPARTAKRKTAEATHHAVA